MTALILNIAPEVAEILGSEDVILAAFDTAEVGFLCTACGQPGKLTPTDRASVVVYRPERGDGAPIVRYAHEHCAASDVIDTDAPNLVDPGSVWPAQAWLRPHGGPRAVVLVGPRMLALRVTDGGEPPTGSRSNCSAAASTCSPATMRRCRRSTGWPCGSAPAIGWPWSTATTARCGTAR